jgi:hypothetical protein
MELEQPSGDSAAVVDTATPVEAAGEPNEPIQQYDDNGLPIEAAPVDDDIEEELDGVKLRGKKEALERIKAERLMNKDYTQKTQATAEERRVLAAEREQFQKAAQLHQQYLEEVADVRMIDKRLSQFSQVNWQQLTDQDPVQALKLHTEFTQLQAQKGQLVNALTQKQQQAQHMQQRETAKQLMEARQVLERDIKGWSPELAGKLMDFGLKQGFPADAMQNITQPAIVKMLHKAYLFDQLETQRKAKAPPAPAPPVSRVSGAAAANTKPLSEVSDAEYIRRRREYQSKNR